MAQKVEVRLLDDLDGGQADETVKFAIDLRKVMDQYLEAGRRIGRMSSSGSRRGAARSGGRSLAETRERNQAIRDWAKSKGLEVSDRGRISQDLVDQYEAEAGK
jgi:hypothetical protein